MFIADNKIVGTNLTWSYSSWLVNTWTNLKRPINPYTIYVTNEMNPNFNPV